MAMSFFFFEKLKHLNSVTFESVKLSGREKKEENEINEERKKEKKEERKKLIKKERNLKRKKESDREKRN